MTNTISASKVDGAQTNSSDYWLWDFAGVDGLQAAIALFSPAISHLSPFQSLTAEFGQQPCSVLRLCENNFRVALPEPMAFDSAISALELSVWVKPCPAATLLLPVEAGLERLRAIATTKPIYTLHPFPCDRAVPARINDLAILAWHHSWQGQPRLTLQTAQENVEAIQRALTS
ncbi:hypothetical protein [Halomicronema sp. CCY15110]|uniref:hypothetical protein n=1 Tax=Halomicronema sp. CCY15110 TaxID=2767773 RepID=UPI001951FE33|nr:hypothetical protein [Halomicronema sp. CCY15110]